MRGLKSAILGAVLAIAAGIPESATAQRVFVGPDGPSFDFRTRRQRMRDREDARRDGEETRRERHFRGRRYEDDGFRHERRRFRGDDD